jgi:hypothetical protein
MSEGCLNDVFLMSSVLQESGFDPEEIRVVRNERATTQGMIDRMHWLLDGLREGDERVRRPRLSGDRGINNFTQGADYG